MKISPLHNAAQGCFWAAIIWTALTGTTASGQTFYSQTVSNDLPLAYWDFDEINPTDPAIQQMPPLDSANDLVAAFSATRIAHSQINSGMFLGNAADLDGHSNFNSPALNLPERSLAGPYAVEFWMQTQIDAASGRNDYILSTDLSGVQGIGYDWTPDLMYFESHGASTGILISDQDTNWHHVVWVHYGALRTVSKLDIYLDGVRNANLVDAPGDALNLGLLTLGDYRPAGGLGYLGRLDEVAIFDLRAYTSEAQVAARVAALVSDHRKAATVEAKGAAVSITSQPVGALSAVGQTATFTVAASASSGSLTYQWQRNWVDIPGANSAAYTTPVLTTADGGTNLFRVRVSAGNVFINSQEAALAVPVPLSISKQPANMTAKTGDTATFSVGAASSPPAPLSYQWKRNGVNILEATNSSYTTPPLQLADAGTNYFWVVVSAGAAALESDAAELVVTAPAIPQTAYSQRVLSDTPILYWSFDEPQGNAVEQVSQGSTTVNDLVSTAGATRVDHAAIGSHLGLGYAADFNGLNNFNAALPDVGRFTLSGPYGIEFWIQLQEAGGPVHNNDYLISFRDNGGQAVVYDWESDDFIEVYGGTDATRTTTNGPSLASLTDTGWHHVVWVYYGGLRPDDTRRLDAYLDGVRIANIVSGYNAELYLLGPITMGDFRPQGGFGLSGRMDEVAIYDFASVADETSLTTQVETMVAAHLAAALPPMLAYTRAGSQLTLSWKSAGYILQESSSLSGSTWTAVPGGNQSPVALALGSGNKFYRLHKP